MNYQRIYDDLIVKASHCNNLPDVYLERHHIVPDFMFEARSRPGPKGHLLGDPNAPENLVFLTPREHFIAHVLLAKVHKGTRYGYSCASALQFFFTKVIDNSHPRYAVFCATGSRKYERYRIMGLKALSEKAKGKMVVKDKQTGQKIGKVPINHPKVVSGEWVHHSKGMVPTARMIAARTARKTMQSGMNNPNARPDCTTEQIMMCLAEFAPDRDQILKKEFVAWLKLQLKCSERIIVSRFGNFGKFVNQTNVTYGLNINYDPYYRIPSVKR